MKRPIAPLFVCSMAASFATGALLFADDSPPAAVSAPAAPAATPGAPYAGAAPTAAPATPPTLVIQDFAFSTITVPSGATVTVVNRDAMQHTVGGDGFGTGLIDAGGTATLVAPSEPGTYALSCGIHPSMTGSLIVT